MLRNSKKSRKKISVFTINKKIDAKHVPTPLVLQSNVGFLILNVEIN